MVQRVVGIREPPTWTIHSSWFPAAILYLVVAHLLPDDLPRLMQELHFEEWEFSIYFVGYVDPADIPSDPKERTRWCFKQVHYPASWRTGVNMKFLSSNQFALLSTATRPRGLCDRGNAKSKRQFAPQLCADIAVCVLYFRVLLSRLLAVVAGGLALTCQGPLNVFTPKCPLFATGSPAPWS